MEAQNDTAMTTFVEIGQSIDNIDAAIIYMLAERFHCTERVGVLNGCVEGRKSFTAR